MPLLIAVIRARNIIMNYCLAFIALNLLPTPSQKALRAISAVHAIKHMGGHTSSHEGEASGDDLDEHEATGEV